MVAADDDRCRNGLAGREHGGDTGRCVRDEQGEVEGVCLEAALYSRRSKAGSGQNATVDWFVVRHRRAPGARSNISAYCVHCRNHMQL